MRCHRKVLPALCLEILLHYTLRYLSAQCVINLCVCVCVIRENEREGKGMFERLSRESVGCTAMFMCAISSGDKSQTSEHTKKRSLGVVLWSVDISHTRGLVLYSCSC